MDPEHTVTTVFRGASKRACREAELVLRALGIEHDLVPREGGVHLVVAPSDAPRARAEISAYFEENAPRAEADDEPAWTLVGPWLGVALWALALLVFYGAQAGDWGGHDWARAGRTVAGRIRGGEWWRPITALTLHSDLRHLLGNVFFGALFVGPVCQVLGTGLGLWTVLLVGTTGNWLNAMVQRPDHMSLGASTAVFGALGLLGAFQWRRRLRLRTGAMRRWTPVIGAVILLGYLGTSGERTDVLAHVTGFLAGLGVGALLGPLDEPPRDARVQAGFGALAVAALAAAWTTAHGG